METNEGQVKSSKTTKAQLVAYLDFLESHPEFLAEVLSAEHNELCKRQEWEELASILDSFPAAPRLGKQLWPTRLRNWRYALNDKHRRRVVAINATGGGSMADTKVKGKKVPVLKQYEQRAIAIFNPLSTVGDQNQLLEAGIDDQQFIVPDEYIVIANASLDDSSVEPTPTRITVPVTPSTSSAVPATPTTSRRPASTQRTGNQSQKRMKTVDAEDSILKDFLEIEKERVANEKQRNANEQQKNANEKVRLENERQRLELDREFQKGLLDIIRKAYDRNGSVPSQQN